MPYEIDPHIFRAYDIRGDVRTQLTEEAAQAIGAALSASHFPAGSTLVVGQDARLSSSGLSQALVEGLLRQGVNVVCLGQVTTPMLYFALFERAFDGGIMVTGSHNPVYDNGFKICRGRESFVGEDIQRVYQKTLEPQAPAAQRGTLTTWNVFQTYADAIHSRVFPGRPLKLVVDTGNGVAGPFVERVLAPYAQNLEMMYGAPDGRFPHHHPDPSDAKNMVDCQTRVLETHADLGLALDGDGDRLGVVDSTGCLIPADRLLTLFAREILARRRGATILGDVKCSQTTFDDIAHRGGVPCMVKTGHALIKAKIRETQAAMAGEMSGHFFFEDRWFGFDDAIYAAARLCEIVARLPEGQSLSDALSDLPPAVATPEIRVECPDAFKFDLVREMYNRYKERFPTSDLDGARIDFPQGWALVRASNTQPVIVVRIEAQSRPSVTELSEALLRDLEDISCAHGVRIDMSPVEHAVRNRPDDV